MTIFLLISLAVYCDLWKNITYYGKPDKLKGEFKINTRIQVPELLIADYHQLSLCKFLVRNDRIQGG